MHQAPRIRHDRKKKTMSLSFSVKMGGGSFLPDFKGALFLPDFRGEAIQPIFFVCMGGESGRENRLY